MLSVARSAVRRPHAFSASLRLQQSLLVGGPAMQARTITSKDVFSQQVPSGFTIPDIPAPPEAARSIAEMVDAGESVLSELGLISWWKPSSYFRIALEGIHTYADIPWWTTIVCATVALRLALIAVPVMSQKLVAKQSQYKKELDEFRDRIQDARKENNNLLQQQILIEQNQFLKSKDIKLGRQFVVMLANGGVFATQFFALKKMIEVNYPGLSTGGTAWFTDLTACDPYYALPLISALTMGLVSRVGIEMGTSADQMAPAMKLGMQYGLPVIIFAVSSQFASGLCVYWCASNVMSLVYSGAFRTPSIRKLFNIPAVKKYPQDELKKKKNTFSEFMSNYKGNKAAPPTLSDLKAQDAARFKKAGRGKPVVK